MSGTPFEFELPVSFFKAETEPQGKQRRIGGIISTETPDQQGEVVLQRGLDLSRFLQSGWFNDNHSRKTADILGYPEKVKSFDKGDKLPDGSQAKQKGTWVEGYLLDTDKAREIWDLGQALQKTGRRLGYSVEGKIDKREGPGGKVIARATVRNVAITNAPVNNDARLEVLAKSLVTLEHSTWEKSMTMGTPTPGQAIVGVRTGESAGQVITPQSLETKLRVLDFPDEQKKNKVKKGKKGRQMVLPLSKGLTTAQAVAWVQRRLPAISREQALRVVELTKRQRHTAE